jgi:prolyl-tRNA editing enzyme YbaK/EbsC (Cys-tRNA(Pro) deacylase)
VTEYTEHSSVARVKASFARAGISPEVRRLADTARTAVDAATGLGIAVGQIASSIVFRIDDGAGEFKPLLVVTSGRHRVDTELVAASIGQSLHRADADFVRAWSGFAIGGVSPTGWQHEGLEYLPQTLVDVSLREYPEVWAAAGHTHVVYQTTFDDLVAITGGTPLQVAQD